MGGNKKNKKGKTPASNSGSEAGSGTPIQPPQPAINPHVGARYTPIPPSAGHPAIPAPSTRLDGGFNQGTPNAHGSDEEDTDEEDQSITNDDMDSDGEPTEAYLEKKDKMAERLVEKYGADAHQGIHNPDTLRFIKLRQPAKAYRDETERKEREKQVSEKPKQKKRREEEAESKNDLAGFQDGMDVDEKTMSTAIAPQGLPSDDHANTRNGRAMKGSSAAAPPEPDSSGDDTDANEDDNPENRYSDGEPTEAYKDKIATKAFRKYKKYGDDALQGLESQLLYDAIQDLMMEEGGVEGVDTEAHDAEKVRKERERRARWGVQDGKAKSQDDLKQERGREKQHEERVGRERARIVAGLEDDVNKDSKALATFERDPPSTHTQRARDHDPKKSSNKKPEPGPEGMGPRQTQEGRKIAKPRLKRPDRAPKVAAATSSVFANFPQQAGPSTPQAFSPGTAVAQTRDEYTMEVDMVNNHVPAQHDPSVTGNDDSGAYANPGQFVVRTGSNLNIDTSDGRPSSYPDPQEDPQNTSPYNSTPQPNSALNSNTYTSALSPDAGHGAPAMTGFGEFTSGPPSGSAIPPSDLGFTAALPVRQTDQPSNIDPRLLDLGGNPGPSAPAVFSRPVIDQSSTSGPLRPARKKSGDIAKKQGIIRRAGEPGNNTENHTHIDQQYSDNFTAGGKRSSLPSTEPAAAPRVDRDGDEPMELDDKTATQTTDEIRDELTGVLPSESDEDTKERDPILSPRYQPESPSSYPRPEKMEIDNDERGKGPRDNTQIDSNSEEDPALARTRQEVAVSNAKHKVDSSDGYHPRSPPRALGQPEPGPPGPGRIPQWQKPRSAIASGVGGSNGPTTPASPDSTDKSGGNYAPRDGDAAMKPYETCADPKHDRLVEKLNDAYKSEAEAKDKVKNYDSIQQELDDLRKGKDTEAKESDKCKAKCTTLEKDLAKVRAEFDAFKSQHQDCPSSRKDDQGKNAQSTIPSSKTNSPGPVKLPGLRDSMHAVESPPQQPAVPNQDPDHEMTGLDEDTAPLPSLPKSSRPTDVAGLTAALDHCETLWQDQTNKAKVAGEKVAELTTEWHKLEEKYNELMKYYHGQQEWIEKNKGKVIEFDKNREKVELEEEMREANRALEQAKQAAHKAQQDLETARSEYTAAQNVLQTAKKAVETKLEESTQQVAQLMAKNNTLFKEASRVQAEHNQCGQKQKAAVALAEDVAKTELEKSKKKQAELEEEKKAAAEELQKLQTEHVKCKKDQADALAAAAKKCDEEKAALGPRRRTREPGEKRPEKCTVQRHREYKEMIRMAAEATTSMVDAVTRMQDRWEALP